jgi:very-short-patch-repair endonuclease
LEQEEYNEERTKYLESLGYKVIRFWNNDVTNNIDGVILAIMKALEDETILKAGINCGFKKRGTKDLVRSGHDPTI